MAIFFIYEFERGMMVIGGRSSKKYISSQANQARRGRDVVRARRGPVGGSGKGQRTDYIGVTDNR